MGSDRASRTASSVRCRHECSKRSAERANDVVCNHGLRLVDKLPQTPSGQAVARQLARRATSVGANYRASCNARSRNEFVARLGVVVEESDETAYWLSIIINTQWLPPVDLMAVHDEALELRAIFAKSLGTARASLKNDQIK
jgi:four helix bundle protein